MLMEIKGKVMSKGSSIYSKVAEAEGRKVEYDDDDGMIKLSVLKQSVPKSMRPAVTQEMVDILNSCQGPEDEMFAESYRENFMSYIGVVRDGHISLKKYIDGVKYCSHKMLGATNIDAYMLTFPYKYQRLIDIHTPKGLSVATIRDEVMAPYVKAYTRGKIVNRIMEQTLIPSKILNAPYYQQALNVNVDLMMTAKSELVRMQAADSVMRETKMDTDVVIKMDVGVGTTDAIADMMSSLGEMAYKQREHIEQDRVSLKELGAMKVKTEFIEGEVVEGDEDE